MRSGEQDFRKIEEMKERENIRANAIELLDGCIDALEYLADLNGSEWIKGDGVGETDMRQRAKGLQQQLYKIVKRANPSRYAD